jgi:hypothetical protein
VADTNDEEGSIYIKKESLSKRLINGTWAENLESVRGLDTDDEDYSRRL